MIGAGSSASTLVRWTALLFTIFTIFTTFCTIHFIYSANIVPSTLQIIIIIIIIIIAACAARIITTVDGSSSSSTTALIAPTTTTGRIPEEFLHSLVTHATLLPHPVQLHMMGSITMFLDENNHIQHMNMTLRQSKLA